ncbi:MAG: stage III sporulation protein AA [Clostridiales bacterium]|nr:stage III sporulation protein AA [Clostridiales bacterium]
MELNGNPERKNTFISGVLSNISERVRAQLAKISDAEWEKIEEIRLRNNRPVAVEGQFGRRYLSREGKLLAGLESAYNITSEEIIETLELMSESSIYAFVDEIKEGFITLQGGHRVGICGRAIVRNGVITNICNVSGLNIRIAKEIKGASDGVVKVNALPENLLIISPPNCGKTTMLRDIACKAGNLYKVGIVDERGEIAGFYKGVAQYDIGVNSDCMDLCPKSLGIDMLVRSMSPEVIVVDEIASNEDMRAVRNAANSGVRVIASAHGFGVEDVMRRINICMEVFSEVVILSRKSGGFSHVKIAWGGNNSGSKREIGDDLCDEIHQSPQGASSPEIGSDDNGR